MRLLQVHTFNYPRGGDWTHFNNVTILMKEKGHEIIEFCMHHPQNIPSEFDKYFVSYIDFPEELRKGSIFTAPKIVSRSIFSLEAYKKIKSLIVDYKPEVVLIHGFLHHLTPSILTPLKALNIPILITLHDYTILCPNSAFITHAGDICEACKRLKYYMPVIKKCKKNSRGASLIAGLENSLHRLFNVWNDVSFFIGPSQFIVNKFIEYGFPEHKLCKINNFVFDQIKPSFTNDNYALYVGRIDKIKGLENLFNAFKKIPQYSLKIVGEGPYESYLKSFIKNNKIKNIEMLGFKSGKELENLYRGSKYFIYPSIWYENFPYSVLEAMQYGKPNIVSKIGGLPEQVEHGEDGFVFQFDSVEELKKSIIMAENSDLTRLGKNAHKKVITLYNKEIFYDKFMDLINKVV